MTVRNLLNYTRIENAHKARKKIFDFSLCGCYMYNYWGQNKCGLVGVVMINPPEMPIKMTRVAVMLILQAQVCSCIVNRWAHENFSPLGKMFWM